MDVTRHRGDRGDSRGQVHVVDDETVVTTLLARVLRRAGHRVETWNDPRTFLAEALEQQPVP